MIRDSFKATVVLAVAAGAATAQSPATAPRPRPAVTREVEVDVLGFSTTPGFAARCGLTAAGGPTGPGVAGVYSETLSAREARLFHAALRAETGMTVRTRVRMAVTDLRPGTVRSESGAELVTGLEAVETRADGTTLYAAKTTRLDDGWVLAVSARPLQKSVEGVYLECELRVRSHNAPRGIVTRLQEIPSRTAGGPRAGRAAAPVLQCVYSPGFDESSMQSSALVPPGAMLVIGGECKAEAGGRQTESVWVLTPVVPDDAPAKK